MTRKIIVSTPQGGAEERYEDLGPSRARVRRTLDFQVPLSASTIGPRASAGGKVSRIGPPGQR